MTSGWREQYDRMKRWHARLTESTAVDDRRVDDFYAFFACCFHLKDWMKADLDIDAAIRASVETCIDGSLWLRLCADITNVSKHRRLTTRPPRIDADARVVLAGVAFDHVGFGPGLQTDEMIVVPDSGTAWDAMDVANRCVLAWERFLGENGLLVEDRG